MQIDSHFTKMEGVKLLIDEFKLQYDILYF